jgi:F-type H+-transporting ATPase subunit gamma
MGSLKEIRDRIASIKNTRQVTNAMKMVSAAKLKKAQDAIIKIIPFDQKLHEILESMNFDDMDRNPFFKKHSEPENILVVVIGSNRGLCGGFNTNIAKTTILHISENYSYQLKLGKVKLLLIGRQLEKHFKTLESSIIDEAHELMNNLLFINASEISDKLMNLYLMGNYQQIDLVYNKYKNAAVQLLTCEQFLPIFKPETTGTKLKTANYVYEPSQEDVLAKLIPESLKIHLFRVILESNTAEQGARMTAMHQATENASDLIKDLKTTYNNARQSAITNEILEITAGAEALRKG